MTHRPSPAPILVASIFAILTSIATTAEAQIASAYVCPPNQEVAPGTCVCPSGTQYASTPGTCSTGRCTCVVGTQWNGQACIAIPPPPPPPPPPPQNSCGVGCPGGQVCVNGYCVGTGDLRFTLTWDRPGDLDLRVVTPSGREIFYGAQNFDGGRLDRDDRTGTGPENIFWNQPPPPGRYLVCVDPYRITSAANFQLTVASTGLPPRVFSGSRAGSSRGACNQSSGNFLTEIVVGASGGCPPNAVQNPYTRACECQPGMLWNGQMCLPPPPPTCGYGCAAGQVCVNGACVGNGDLRFTLTWDRPGDVDLHVVTPNGHEIYYRARDFDGGTLDRDDRTGTGPENIYWPRTAQPGTYLVCVDPYAITAPTNFTVTIAQSGSIVRSIPGLRYGQERGACTRSSPNFLTELTVGGAGGGWGGGGGGGGGAFQWIAASGGSVPSGAVVGGREANGQPLYVCRGSYRGGVHVGKIVGASCNIGWGGSEVPVASYEVLVGGAGRWLAASGGSLVPGAFVGGTEANGQPLFVCRASYQGGVHVGKVVGATCNFGWGGREIGAPAYEVLVP